MIKVNIDIKDRILKKIYIQGHSGFSIKGSDVVCSAISILIYGAYLSLTNIPFIEIKFKDDSDKIYLEILKVDNQIIGELRGITIFLISGLKATAKDYPENIKLNIKGE